jgi:hypothetical protein
MKVPPSLFVAETSMLIASVTSVLQPVVIQKWFTSVSQPAVIQKWVTSVSKLAVILNDRSTDSNINDNNTNNNNNNNNTLARFTLNDSKAI